MFRIVTTFFICNKCKKPTDRPLESRSSNYSQEFAKAAEDVKKLKSKPTDNELLELYALYKQSTVGDCDTQRPGMLDLKGKAKWDAWNSKKGMTKDDAKRAYLNRANILIETYGLS